MTLMEVSGVWVEDPAGRGCDPVPGPGDVSGHLIADAFNAIAALEHLRLDEVEADERADAVRDLDQVRSMLEAHFSRGLREFAAVDNLHEVGTASMSGWLVAATERQARADRTTRRGCKRASHQRDWDRPLGLASVVGSSGRTVAPAT